MGPGEQVRGTETVAEQLGPSTGWKKTLWLLAPAAWTVYAFCIKLPLDKMANQH